MLTAEQVQHVGYDFEIREDVVKALTRYLTFQVPKRMDFVNITRDVAAAVQESGVQEGICLVNAMHITASVFINDEESGLKED